ncbi:hypothetical protein [Pseudomonas alkylphenolica]|uniref:hypothetical protein n=1 Tax=Pseudomonas alkylphenolica TaxID=237609 RepID=UPI00315D9135
MLKSISCGSAQLENSHVQAAVAPPVKNDEGISYIEAVQQWGAENKHMAPDDVRVAVARLTDAFERKSYTLDFSKLNITSLPPLYSGLVELDISDCYLLPVPLHNVPCEISVIRPGGGVAELNDKKIATELLVTFERNKSDESFLLDNSVTFFQMIAFHMRGDDELKGRCLELYEGFVEIQAVKDTIDAAECVYGFEKNLSSDSSWNIVLVNKSASVSLNLHEFTSFFKTTDEKAVSFLANLIFYNDGSYEAGLGALVREFPVLSSYKDYWMAKLVINGIFDISGKNEYSKMIHGALADGDFIALNDDKNSAFLKEMNGYFLRNFIDAVPGKGITVLESVLVGLFGMPDFITANDREKGEILFCLAAVCTKLSSVSCFGRPEGRAIAAFADLGIAFMNSSLGVCPDIFGCSDKSQKASSEFFSDTCRARSAESLLSLINVNGFSDFKHKIIPPDWC